jgi:predicted GNAT family acetyltransferase
MEHRTWTPSQWRRLRPEARRRITGLAVLGERALWFGAEATVHALLDGPTVVAVARVLRQPGAALIRNVAVLPERRGRGLCGALLKGIMAAGRGPFVLDVDPANTAAVRCYEKLGFRPTGAAATYGVRYSFSHT